MCSSDVTNATSFAQCPLKSLSYYFTLTSTQQSGIFKLLLLKIYDINGDEFNIHDLIIFLKMVSWSLLVEGYIYLSQDSAACGNIAACGHQALFTVFWLFFANKNILSALAVGCLGLLNESHLRVFQATILPLLIKGFLG